MPCYDERNSADYAREGAKAESREKIDILTRVACDLSNVLRARGTPADLHPVTQAWIKAHDEWDARRKARGEA